MDDLPVHVHMYRYTHVQVHMCTNTTCTGTTGSALLLQYYMYVCVHSYIIHVRKAYTHAHHICTYSMLIRDVWFVCTPLLPIYTYSSWDPTLQRLQIQLLHPTPSWITRIGPYSFEQLFCWWCVNSRNNQSFKFMARQQVVLILVQFVKQKSSKIIMMLQEVREMKEKLQSHQTNNKITFQEQIIKEK